MDDDSPLKKFLNGLNIQVDQGDLPEGYETSKIYQMGYNVGVEDAEEGYNKRIKEAEKIIFSIKTLVDLYVKK